MGLKSHGICVPGTHQLENNISNIRDAQERKPNLTKRFLVKSLRYQSQKIPGILKISKNPDIGENIKIFRYNTTLDKMTNLSLSLIFC